MPPINSYSDGVELPVQLQPQQQRPQQQRVTPSFDSAPPVLLILLLCAILPAMIALGLALYNPMLVVGALLAIVGVILMLARPYYGLLFFVFLIYTRPEEAVHELAGMHFTLIVAVTALIGMAFGILQRREEFAHSSVLWCMLAFLSIAVLSAIPNSNTADAAMDVGKLFLVLVLMLNLVRTPHEHRALISVMIAVTTYLAAYSIYLNLTGQSLDENGVQRSVTTGLFGDPNDLASTIVAGIALALSRITRSRPLASSLYGALTAILIFAVFLAASRGGFISLILVISYYGWQTFKTHKGAPIIVALLIVGLVAVGARGHMGDFDTKDQSVTNRFIFWQSGVFELIQHPLLGVGYSQFSTNNGGRVEHNTWVQSFAEIGIVGYCFFIGALYFCFKQDRRIAERLRSEQKRDPAFANEILGSRIALGAYLAASFWLTHAFEPVLYIMLCLPLTAQTAAVGVNTITADRSERSTDIWRIIGISLASILVIWFIATHVK